MTKTQREQIRLSCLRYCVAARSMGLGTALLLQALHAEGLRKLEEEELREELLYMEEKGLLERKHKLISPENEIWSVTAFGRDFWAEGEK
jgi:hypothetical protein